jgi:UDP-N-acetyl-D-mannosaminuronic acid dehydrogenase
MPTFVVKQLRRALSETGTDLQDATVLVLGVTYRAGVEETRFSPALTILELLSDFGAETLAVDPLLDDIDIDAELLSQEAAASADLDAAVLVTPHEAFETFPWNDHEDLLVVDTRGVLDPTTIDGRVVTVGRAMEE